jgi:hypothetical protein
VLRERRQRLEETASSEKQASKQASAGPVPLGEGVSISSWPAFASAFALSSTCNLFSISSFPFPISCFLFPSPFFVRSRWPSRLRWPGGIRWPRRPRWPPMFRSHPIPQWIIIRNRPSQPMSPPPEIETSAQAEERAEVGFYSCLCIRYFLQYRVDGWMMDDG